MTLPIPTPLTPMHSFLRFFSDLFYLPRWQKLFLTVAALAAGSAYLPLILPAQASTQPASQNSANVPQTAPVPQSFLRTPHPWLSRTGLSILLGFLAGWLFRAFTKVMAVLTLLFFALLGVLSYFHINNTQLAAAATQEYHQATSWLSQQSTQVKDFLMSHLPSTTGGFVGLFLGAKKKR